MPDDRDLRHRFAELRRKDRTNAREFSSCLHRAGRRAKPIPLSVWVAVSAGLAVMIAAGAMLVPRSGRRNTGSPETSITEWKSGTDFLLRTPGLELLQTIPRIGEWPASTRNPRRRRV
jgi:hypothetical protein